MLVFSDGTDWRLSAKVYRAAMSKALVQVVVGSSNLFEMIDSYVNSAPVDTQITWNEVVQFERSHSDILQWSVPVLISINPSIDIDTFLDALFLFAMVIESGSTDTTPLLKMQGML